MSFLAATGLRIKLACPRAATGLLVAGLVVLSAMAVAQERQPARSEPSLFESLGRWFEKQGQKISSTFKDAGKKVENFGHEAGVAAKTTVEGAKDAAGAVARLPTARVVNGHEKCKTAPNGAPDCVAAATAMCKTKGFESGKSADMTTAEVCSAQVYLSGRSSGPGCRTETFVSRALCQ
ncbi:MAG: hypothetical protein Q8M24_13145 [Pseudolabrys sp.]|nr:hypothetical protein [Pseudolabrys sp.]MDP2296388.1 hypothetical protein [Pseudolabrys sp.]